MYKGQIRKGVSEPFSEIVAVKTLKGKNDVTNKITYDFEALDVYDLFVATSYLL